MTTAIDYLRLSDDQRGVINDVVEMRANNMREGGGDRPFRELGEGMLAFARLEDFADGHGPLASEDRSLLVEMLTRYGAEATETAERGQEELPGLEAGDPELIYIGRTQEQSVELKRGYIVRERLEAKLCGEVLELLGEGSRTGGAEPAGRAAHECQRGGRAAAQARARGLSARSASLLLRSPARACR
jgi:hypothetical protein